MGHKARIACFCTNAISDLEGEGATSSEWCALPCGHIWHTKCVERWGHEQRKAGHAESASTSVIPCPNRCPPSTLSRKDPVSGTRRVVPFVRLYFQEDVQSDGIDSSQIVEMGGSDGMVGIGAYGQRFRPRPPKEGKGKARATEPDAAEQEDEVEEELVEEAEGAASRSLKQEITRLRREAREAISAAREVPGLREQVARLKATNALLEQEVEDRDEAITSLHAEASDRDFEIVELEAGQPKVKKELKEARREVEALKATRMTLEGDVSDLQLELEERTGERDDAINDAHEANIKAGERIQALQLKLESAGTAGEEKIKRMEKEADDLNQIILDVRIEKDRVEHKFKERFIEVRAHATKEIAKAEKAVEEAFAARSMAEENAKAAREEQLRVKNANASWQKKCDKLKQKLLKLEHRRGKVASDDEDGNYNEPLASAPSRSPVKALRRHPTIDSSPEAPLPFKMNVNHVNVPPSNSTTGSGHSRSQSTASAVFSPGSVSSVAAGKRERLDPQIIDLCSDDDEDQVEVEDDLFAAVNDPALASGSGNWSGFGSKGRLTSQSPSSSSKRQRGMPSVPMPTLSSAATGREGSVGLWGPKKVELSKQKSDKHLPDFGGGGRGGVKELGPKSRVKMGAKR